MTGIIDAHHHVWDLAVRDQPWMTGEIRESIGRSFSADDLRPIARAAGVTATVLVQTVNEAGETPEMLALAEADPLIGAVVGWTDLTSPSVVDELARLLELPGASRLAGIRHLAEAEPDQDWLLRPDVLRGLRAVAAAGLCYDLLIVPGQLPAASTVAAAVPDLTLVLDHAGKPPIGSGQLAEWATGIQAFAALPNTVCKLSGLLTDASRDAPLAAFIQVAEALFSAFGPDRVMFGSDWPVCLLAADYVRAVALARSLTAGLSLAEQNSVFTSNAARVYGVAAS